MVEQIIAHLRSVNAQRSEAERQHLLAAIQRLQQWQCQRLLASHIAMAQHPHYAKAIGFFVDELYGPKDFSQRDADLMRVIPKLAKVLPQHAMHAIEQALWLNALSFDLDMAMAQILGSAQLNRHNYALAYRALGRSDERAQQIHIAAKLAAQLNDVVGIVGISWLIKLSRRPAQRAGLSNMHDFLYRGYIAFKDLGDVSGFIDPVIALESQISAQLLDPATDFATENPLPNVQ